MLRQNPLSFPPPARPSPREWIPVVAGFQTWTFTLAQPHVVLNGLHAMLVLEAWATHLIGVALLPWLWRRTSNPSERSDRGDAGRLGLAVLWQVHCAYAGSHRSLPAFLV